MVFLVDLMSNWIFIIGVILMISAPVAIRTYVEWREDRKQRAFDEEHLIGD